MYIDSEILSVRYASMQIKWSSGRPDAQNCRRTTWTSQQVIRGTTRLTSPELEYDFENLFHLFWSASTFKIDGFQHKFSPFERVIVVPESASQAILKGKECSKSLYHCTEECLQGVTPQKRYLCAVRSAMTTLIYTP